MSHARVSCKQAACDGFSVTGKAYELADTSTRVETGRVFFVRCTKLDAAARALKEEKKRQRVSGAPPKTARERKREQRERDSRDIDKMEEVADTNLRYVREHRERKRAKTESKQLWAEFRSNAEEWDHVTAHREALEVAVEGDMTYEEAYKNIRAVQLAEWSDEEPAEAEDKSYASLEKLDGWEISRQLGQWRTSTTDYAAQSQDELTVASGTRLRVVYDYPEAYQKNITQKWGSFSWGFYETADGRRGFLPNCTRAPSPPWVSTTKRLFYPCGHGQLHGWCFSVDGYNKRWREHGMPGEGVKQLWVNWGKGGHDIPPTVYNTTQHCANAPQLAACAVCKACGLERACEQFSRCEWGLLNDSCAQALCIECETVAHGDQRCTCSRNLEVWALCPSCITRATEASSSAHARSLDIAVKLPPGSGPEPSHMPQRRELMRQR